MAQENGKPASRAEMIRQRHRVSSRWMEAIGKGLGPLFSTPRITNAILVAVCFVVVATALAVWARRQPMVAVGRVMTDTRLVRVPLALEDREATKTAREAARQRTPWVFAADMPVLQELRGSLENLPRTLARVQSLDQVEPTIREQFGLTAESLAAVKAEAVNGESSPAWLAMVNDFMNGLRSMPLLDQAVWQRATQGILYSQVTLTFEDPATKAAKSVEGVSLREVMNLGDAAHVRQTLTSLAREAGFSSALRAVVVSVSRT